MVAEGVGRSAATPQSRMGENGNKTPLLSALLNLNDLFPKSLELAEAAGTADSPQTALWLRVTPQIQVHVLLSCQY